VGVSDGGVVVVVVGASSAVAAATVTVVPVVVELLAGVSAASDGLVAVATADGVAASPGSSTCASRDAGPSVVGVVCERGGRERQSGSWSWCSTSFSLPTLEGGPRLLSPAMYTIAGPAAPSVHAATRMGSCASSRCKGGGGTEMGGGLRHREDNCGGDAMAERCSDGEDAEGGGGGGEGVRLE
jgi:hypothetical protein